jgi:hypothetical protein
MIRIDTLAIVNYQHLPEEVAELATAIVPLRENIRAVATQSERDRMRAILGGEQFRYRDAKAMKKMLSRAANHARANLGNYFPLMHQEILAAAENLEEAVKHYWAEFETQEREIIPIS